MQHEVLIDDIAVDQGLDVELLLEDGLDQAILLGTPEPLELGPACVCELDALVLVLQLDLELLLLGLPVEDVVAEVDQNHKLGIGLLGVLERLPGEILVFIRVFCGLCLLDRL